MKRAILPVLVFMAFSRPAMGDAPLTNDNAEPIRLLDLALQQEDPGGCVRIQVDCRREGKRQVLFGQIDSRGLQLQNLELERLFEPFYYRASGLGRLALPVARRIFEAHGGVLSAGLGPEGGLRLVFLLPAV